MGATGYSRAKVKRAFEELLDDGEAFIRHAPTKDFDYFSSQQTANFWAAKKLGFTCMCRGATKTRAAKCECVGDKGGIQRGRKIPTRLDLSGDKNGRECRDGSGAFVPTAWCRGPVGRDPRTGRFVSLKP